MKVPKDRFWGQQMLLSAILCVSVVVSYFLLNSPSVGEDNHGFILIISFMAFFLAVCQVVYCTYYLFFVEYGRRLMKMIWLLVIVLFTAMAYWIAM